MMTARILLMMVLGLLPLSACQSWAEKGRPPAGEVTVEVLYAGQHCGRRQASPALTWIDNEQQLADSLRRIRAGVLGGEPLRLPAPDFRREIALLVEMGQRPTAGYRLALGDGGGLRIAGEVARLTLEWQRPPADAVLAQVLSSPCLLLRAGRGDYTVVQVLDAEGNVRASARGG